MATNTQCPLWARSGRSPQPPSTAALSRKRTPADVAEAETHDQNGAANADCLDEGGRRLDVIELAEDSVLIERLLKQAADVLRRDVVMGRF